MKANRRSKRQESAGAKEFGGRVTPRSGAGWAVKNDVRTERLAIEYKYTDKLSYSLKFEDLEKAKNQALVDGARDMLFIVEGNGQEWVTVSKEFMLQLLTVSGVRW